MAKEQKITIDRVRDAMAQFETRVVRGSVGESDKTARIIGEFSSGKTRFLRALLGDKIPANLAPISSPEIQTLLPLEVSYGEKPSLTLIRRAEDADEPETLRVLEHFPERAELADVDAASHRLRLTVAEPRLIIADEDASEGQSVLRLIDQPGWNSEDEGGGLENLGLSDEWENMALIYVCKLSRLDSAVNQKNLALFIEALQSGEIRRARTPLPLLFVITECPPEERKRKIADLAERVNALLDLYPDKFAPAFAAIDLADADEDELNALRSLFWDGVAPPGPEEHSVAQRINAWPARWKIEPWLAQSFAWIDTLNRLAATLKPRGKYLGGRDMSYFHGLSTSALRAGALEQWLKMIGPDLRPDRVRALEPPRLPADHPLNPWLDAYWLPRLRAGRDAIANYLDKVGRALSSELTPRAASLEDWLDNRVGAEYKLAAKPFSRSFQSFLDQARTLTGQADQAALVENLFGLSLVEIRHAEEIRKAEAREERERLVARARRDAKIAWEYVKSAGRLTLRLMVGIGKSVGRLTLRLMVEIGKFALVAILIALSPFHGGRNKYRAPGQCRKNRR